MPWTIAQRKAYEAKIKKTARAAHNLNDNVAKQIIEASIRARNEVHKRLLAVAEGRRTGKLTANQVDKLRAEAKQVMENFRQESLEIMRNALELAQKSGTAATQAFNTELGIGATPLITPEMVAQSYTYTADLITGLSDETLKAVETELSRSLLTGESPYDVMRNIDDAMGIGRDTGISAKAERIVRTELGRAHSSNQQAGFNSLAEKISPDERGLLMKTWHSAKHPGRTRSGHWEADGQIVPFDQPFRVRSSDGSDGKASTPYEDLMYPGDPIASPGNTINCLCTMDISAQSIDNIIAYREGTYGTED